MRAKLPALRAGLPTAIKRDASRGDRRRGLRCLLFGAALGVGILIVWRSALLQLYIAARLDKWAFRAFDNTVIVLLALVWLALVVVAEAWYREAARKGLLRRRFVRAVVAEAVAGAVGYAVQWLV